MMTLDQALTDIMQLDDSSREMLLDILFKRQVEARRDEIARNAKKSIKEYRSGKYTPLSNEESISNHLNSL
jgi:hypothetical protein